jgi:predicted RNase H-like HicB family nuclease
MFYEILLTQQPHQYQARVRDWPEIMVTEKTREQALQQVRSKLVEYLAQPVEIVKMEVPSPPQVSNHWLTHFGCCRDDPTFDQLEVEIAKYRRQREEGEGEIKE